MLKNSNKSIILWVSVVFNSIKTTSGYRWISLRLLGLVDSKVTLLSWDWKGQVQRLLCWDEIERDKFRDCSTLALRLFYSRRDTAQRLLSIDLKGTGSDTVLLSGYWSEMTDIVLLQEGWSGLAQILFCSVDTGVEWQIILPSKNWKGLALRLLCWIMTERNWFWDCSAEQRLKWIDWDCIAEWGLKWTHWGRFTR